MPAQSSPAAAEQPGCWIAREEASTAAQSSPAAAEQPGCWVNRCRNLPMHPPPPLDVRPEVAAALQAERPVVAMVSGPIAHTLPWPANLETVRLAEAAVRTAGGTLALVGVCAAG